MHIDKLIAGDGNMKTAKTLLSLVICGIVLAGCGDDGERKAPSQVLAKVNGKEITVLQLNYLLAQQPKADNETKQNLLDSLIEQELMVQKAEELKLDRNPDVLQSVEFAKKQMFAQAAIQHLVGKRVEPSAADVDKYYNEHPNLFSNRQIYDVAVFLLNANDMTDATNTAIENSTNSEQTQQILEKEGIKFKQTEAKRSAEQIPAVVLDKLVMINIGDIVKVPDENGNIVLMQLIARTPQFVSKADAEQSIKQLLLNDQVQNKAQDQLKLIKDAAKIEYLQKFADVKPSSAVDNKSAEKPTDEHLKSGLKGLN